VQATCQCAHAHPFIKSIQLSGFCHQFLLAFSSHAKPIHAGRSQINHVFAELMRISRRERRSAKIGLLIHKVFVAARDCNNIQSIFEAVR
jgi:hypothetical protein